jgi:adenylate cyclase
MRSVRSRIATLGAAVGLLGVVLSALPPILEVEEALGLGWLFTVRGPIAPPAEVAIISLSRDSADALEVSSDVDEWPRARHGDLIERLTRAGAAVIAFDIIFDAPRVAEPGGDARLAEAIATAGNVVLVERVREVPHDFGIGERRFRPIEPFREGALSTAPFMLPLVPARVSQSWTFGRGDDTPSLPAAVLHAFALPVHDRFVAMLMQARPDLEGEHAALDMTAVRLHGLQTVMRRLRALFAADSELARELLRAIGPASGEDTRALRALVELYAGSDSRYLNFYGPATTIESMPYHEVFESAPSALRERVGGRAVFVGFAEHRRRSEQQDFFDSVFSERSGQRLSGVEIGATAFANLLRSESVKPLSLPMHWLLTAAWGLAVAAQSLWLRGVTAIAAAAGASAVFAAAVHLAFQHHGMWVPLVVPLGVQLPLALVAGLSWNYTLLRGQRERIHAALGYYLPAGEVKRLADETAWPRSSRQLVFGTCLVTDAEHYTTLSEALHPAELGDLMDAYYDALVQAVDRHGGVVSDIGGDSMVAVWPTTRSVDAARAAASRAALAVLDAVESFNSQRVSAELPTRIGLDSGQLLLGNVGASGRGEYRAVGDIVNTAARLQGLNRLLGTRVLVSAASVVESPDFVYRAVGDFLLVGKRTPITVMELRSKRDADSELVESFARALAQFRSGDWDRAEGALRDLAGRFPADRAAHFFLAECRRLRGVHPRGDWDGVVRVTVK